MGNAAVPAFLSPFSRPLPGLDNACKSIRQPRRRKHFTRIPKHPAFPVARVRRGLKPEPNIPATLFEAEPVKDIDFNVVDFSSFKDCVVFVVNVASEDDYTDSVYTLLSSLLDKYYEIGFRVIAFPSNWYGQKETGTNEEIKKFVHDKYSDKIKLMSKVDIDWSEIFALGMKYFPGEVIWNFHGKFLFNRQGMPVARFDLLTEDEFLEKRVSFELMNGSAAPHDDAPSTTAPPEDVGADGNESAYKEGAADDEESEEDELPDDDFMAIEDNSPVEEEARS